MICFNHSFVIAQNPSIFVVPSVAVLSENELFWLLPLRAH